MGKLQRRKISSRALENRQMFAADIVQSVFVPLDEAAVATSLDSIYSAITPAASGTIASSIAITITEDGTDLYYDHWEDGYDADPFAPASTTEVYTNLQAGDVIVLANAIDTITAPAGNIYDASDRISATGTFNVTRELSDAALGGGSQENGGFVSVATGEYIGSQFTLPFGSDTTVDSETPFSYASLHIVAYQDLTSVQLDIGGTIYDFGALTAGQTLYIAEGVVDALSVPVGALTAGATVTADGDIALYAIAGSAAAQDSYWFTLLPDANWSNDYYVPVATVSADATEAVSLIVYNDNATSLSLNIDTLDDTGTIISQNITLAANSTETLTGLTSGTRLYSVDSENFGVLGITGDADWGFTPVSASSMSTEFYIGQALDADASSASNPIWVTANGDTRVYVTGTDQISVVDSYGVSLAVEQTNYNGETLSWFTARGLGSYRILNAEALSDQSGLKVYTDGRAEIAVAYGADPSDTASSYYIGNTLIQSAAYGFTQSISESDSVSNNLDGQVQLGEEVEVSVRFENRSSAAISDWSISNFLTDTTASTLLDGGITLTINNPIAGQETIVLTADQLRSGIDWQLATASLETGAELVVTYRLTIIDAVNDDLINASYSLVGSPSLSLQRPDGENYTTTSLTAVSIDVPVIFEPSTNSSLSIPINRNIAGTLIDAFNQKLVFKPQGGEGIDSLRINGILVDLTNLPLTPTVDTSASGAEPGGELRLDSFDATTGVLTFAYSAQVAGTDTIAVVLVDTAGVTSNYDLVFDVIPALDDPTTVTLAVVSDQALITEGGSAAVTFTLPSLNTNTSTPLEGWRTLSIDLSGSSGVIINDENIAVAAGSQFTGAYGVLTLLSFDLSTGQFDFTYESDPLLDHSSGDLTETFTFSAEDLNFYPANDGTLDITISGVDTYPAPLVPINQSFIGLTSNDGLAQLGEQVSVTISFENQSGATISDWSISDFLTDTTSSTLLDAGITLTITHPPAAVEVINLTADQLRSGIDWQLALVNGSSLAAGAVVDVTYTLAISDSIDNTLIANGYALASEPALTFRDADGDASSTTTSVSVPVDVPVIFEPSENWSLAIPSNRDVFGSIDLQNQRLLLSPQNGPLLSSTVTIAGVSVNLATLSASTDQTISTSNGGVLTLTNLVVSADGGSGELYFDFTANPFTSAYVDSVPVTLNDGVAATSSYNLDFSIIPPITAPVLTLSGSGATLTEGDLTPLSGITLRLTPVSGWNILTIGSETIIKDGIRVANGTVFSGTYGVLTLVSANTSTGVFNFSYLPSSSLDHSSGPSLSEVFIFSAEDISGDSPADQTLTINIVDTNQTASNDSAGTASSVALLEDRLKVFSGSVRINDTDSADGLNAIVGVIAGNSDLTPKDDLGANDSIIVNGEYGQLEMFASGQYIYRLNNADVKVQALGTGEVVTDVFTYTSADTDANLANNLDSYSTATLTINIGGQDDPAPVLREDEGNFSLAIPDDRNWPVYQQKLILEVQGGAEIESLTINTEPIIVNGIYAPPASVLTQHGRIGFMGYEYDSLSSTGVLTYFYEELVTNAVGDLQDTISVELTDSYNEKVSYDLRYLVVPATSPVVSFDGVTAINEGDTLTGINVSSTPIGDWRTLSVQLAGGDTLALVTDAVAAGGGGQLIGEYGVLDFLGYNGTTEEFEFSYTANSALDHSVGSLSEIFSFSAVDRTGADVSEDLSIDILDSAQITVDDVVPGTPVSEDGTLIYTGAVGVRDNDTDSADGFAAIVGVVPGDAAEVPTDTGGATVTATGIYGSIVIDATTGDYTYTLDNESLAVQRLKTGEVVTETFTYTSADTDADIDTNPGSYGNATLTINIGGLDDPEPSISESAENWTLNIPLGKTIAEQELQLEVQAPATIQTLSFKSSAEFTLDLLTLTELEQLSWPDNTQSFATTEGQITLRSFNSTTGILTFDYEPTDPVTVPVIDTVYVELLDSLNGTGTYTLDFDVIPAIDPVALSISFESDTNVVEQETLTGISLSVLPIEGWRNLSVGSMSLIVDGVVQPTGQLVGDYGVLNFLGVNPTTDEFEFSYESNSALDHSTMSWTETFSFAATDLADNSTTATLTLDILDSQQSPQDDTAPGIPVSEDGTLLYTGTVAVRDNDTDSVDGFAAIVGVVSGDTGDVPSDTGGATLTATGVYGSIEIDAVTGDYVYTLDNLSLAVQRLKTGEVVAETFTYTSADADADIDINPNSYGNATLTINIAGLDDAEPEVIASPSNSTLEIPENGGVSGQQLTFVSDVGIEQLTVNDTVFTETVLLSANDASPLSVATTLGRLIITGYDAGTGVLTYGYEPTEGAVTANVTDTFDLVFLDQNYESLAYSLNFNLLPALTEGPSISVVDANGAVAGDIDVDEGSNYLAGIQVFVTPGSGWNQISVEGQNVVAASQIQIIDNVGTTIIGEYGTLVLRSGDRSTGLLVFDYYANPVIDHSSGTLFDQFTFSATDLLGEVAETQSLSVLVNDTRPLGVWDDYGDAGAGVVTEGDAGDEVQRASGNVIDNDMRSLDEDHYIAGYRAGGGLLEFISNDSVFIPKADGGLGVVGTYGTLWMTQDGSFTYELNNDFNATQRLVEGQVVADQFTYVLADGDASTQIADGISAFTGYSSARLTIWINGEDDPVPVIEVGENNVQVAVSSGTAVQGQTMQIELSEGSSVETLSIANQDIPLLALASLTSEPIILNLAQGVMTITDYVEVDGVVTIVYNFTSTSTISGVQEIPVRITDSKGVTGELTIGIQVTPPLMTEIPQITRTDLLEVDATGTLVRAVYNQEVGEPSVQPVTPVIFDAAQVFNGEFEPSDIIDDRSIGIESVRPNEVEERGYEAFLDLFDAPSRVERDTGGIEPFDVDAYELKAQKNIPPQLLGIESREIEYLIPADTFLHTDDRATISLAVTLLDGSPLPVWLKFDPNTAGFSGTAPADVSGEFIFRIIARDDEGRQAETLMRLIVDDSEQVIESVSDDELLEQTPPSNQTSDQIANKTAGAAGEVNAAT